MTDPVRLSDARVWLGPYAIETYLNAIDLTASKAELPDARLGDVAEVAYPGLESVVASARGFFAGGAGASDKVGFDRLSAQTIAWPWTVAPPNAPAATAGADGNTAYVVPVFSFGHTFGAQHGQSLPFAITNRPAGGGTSPGQSRLYRGRVMLPKATYAATTNGTGRQLGAVPAGKKLVAVLHVFAVTGGTWTLTVESDVADTWGGAETVRATFTGATAITTEIKEVAGAVTDTWWRVVLTKSGGTSCVAAAVLAIT